MFREVPTAEARTVQENTLIPLHFFPLFSPSSLLVISSPQRFILRTRDHYPFNPINNLFPLSRLPLLGPLAVSLGGVVTLVDDEVLGPVVVAAGEVGVEDGLGAGGVALLGVERGTGHVRDGGVAGGAAPVLVGGGAEGVVLGSGLGEPNVAAVAAELARGEGLGDVLLDDDGATGGVDEPGA